MIFGASPSKEGMLRLIATCMWNLHHALWVMDHAGLILRDDEAEDEIPKKNWDFLMYMFKDVGN